ncbi:MAG: hypothetical protein AB8H79_26705, partial [Myxococcota bacterium]
MNRHYEQARNGLKKALVAMTDEEARTMGMESWYMIGTSYVTEDRFAEAVFAFIAGLESYGAVDPRWIDRTIDRLVHAANQLRRQSKSDPALHALHGDVVKALMTWARSGPIGSPYRDGNWLMVVEEFSKAAEAFAEVQKDDLYYDIARARRCYALARAGHLGDARRAMKDLRTYFASPEAEIPTDERMASKDAVRRQALGELEYRSIDLEYREAVGLVDDVERDRSRYREVIAKFDSFVNDHDDSVGAFVPYALDAIGRLHAELGELDRAEEAYRRLPTNPYHQGIAAKLITVLLKGWQDEVNSREAALAAATTKGANSGEGVSLEALRKKLDDGHRKVLSLSREYSRAASVPQYGVMSTALASAKALGEWEDVEALARAIIDQWGSNPDFKNRVDAVVRPALDEAASRKDELEPAAVAEHLKDNF